MRINLYSEILTFVCLILTAHLLQNVSERCMPKELLCFQIFVIPTQRMVMWV